MFTLLSKRIKNASGELEVYIYDDLLSEFRNQVYYIMRDVINPYNGYDIMDEFDLWNDIYIIGLLGEKD